MIWQVFHKNYCVHRFLETGSLIQTQRDFVKNFIGPNVAVQQGVNCPTHQAISDWVSDLGHYNVRHAGSGRPASAVTQANANLVNELIQEQPTTSQRNLKDRLRNRYGVNVSQSSICRIIDSLGLHPYRLLHHQALEDGDAEDRLTFAQVRMHINSYNLNLERVDKDL